MRIVELNENNKKNLMSELLKRSPQNYQAYNDRVMEILDNVRTKGDEALFGYTEKFDGAKLTPESIVITQEEIDEAVASVDPALIETMKRAAANIEEFHKRQLPNSWFMTKEDGCVLGQKVSAIDSVGVYVPGGKAAYPSTLLMNVVPARVAGVKNIYMATPCNREGKVNPATLAAASIAGVTKMFKMGGAQAIAALAYGTETIPKVDKIVGPGNIYVALAKKAVYGFVSIDSVAGPSEVCVIADENANPRYVAADLLSQAEHDELASAILVTTSRTLAEAVSREVDGFLGVLSRREIIEKSLDNFGYILIASSMDDAIDTVNEIAPEHLEIAAADPFAMMAKIKNAGAMFLGEYSSEPLGDYFAGPNHVLPTNGTAKFFSALCVEDFLKKSSIVYYTKDALRAVSDDIVTFAKSEQLTAHANAISVRFENE